MPESIRLAPDGACFVDGISKWQKRVAGTRLKLDGFFNIGVWAPGWSRVARVEGSISEVLGLTRTPVQYDGAILKLASNKTPVLRQIDARTFELLRDAVVSVQ